MDGFDAYNLYMIHKKDEYNFKNKKVFLILNCVLDVAVIGVCLFVSFI